jgi:hypothetical protein
MRDGKMRYSQIKEWLFRRITIKVEDFLREREGMTGKEGSDRSKDKLFSEVNIGLY